MLSERPPGLLMLAYLPFRSSLHAAADPSAALGLVAGVCAAYNIRCAKSPACRYFERNLSGNHPPTGASSSAKNS
jgi:hypothetical protein